MKTLFTILFCAQLFAAYSQNKEKKIQTSVKEVTVFLKGAQVTRTAVADLPAGTTPIVLSGISPKISEESIQVESSGSARILSVSYRVNHLEELDKPAEIRNLNDEKAVLRTQIAEEQSTLEIYQQEESMLNSNKSIGGHSGVEVQELREAVSYFRERMKDIRHMQQQSKNKLGDFNARLAKIDTQLAELKEIKTQPEGEIIIKISSKAPSRSTLKVSYLVQEAGWFPLYDIRAKDILSPIAITYKASVSQQSGEDWKDVSLTVSSGNPSLSGARPTVRPWYLGFYNSHADTSSPILLRGISSVHSGNMVSGRIVDETGQPLPGVNVLIKGTTMGTVSDAGGFYSIVAPDHNGTLVFSFIGLTTQELAIAGRGLIDVSLQSDVTQLSEVVVMGYGVDNYETFGSATPRVRRTIAATPVVRQTNVEFHVQEPYTILSNGETETVEMVEYESETQYQYYCAPKLDKDAFLTAKLTGWDEYNFLEGEASLFFEGKYLGKTVLDTRNISDTLTISLGRDRNVIVTREKVKDVSSSLMIGSNVKNVFAYEISVRNKKEAAIQIRIEDQVPVPNTKEITVDKLEDSDADIHEDTGLMSWDLKVEAGKSDKLILKYQVKYPKHSTLVLE